MFKCPLCEKEYDKLISLSLHYRSIHKKTAKDLYITLYHNGIEPTCLCGCASAVIFLSISKGFREYVRGHAAKVSGKNNWGNNKTAFEHSLKTRKQMIREGKWKPFFLKNTGEHWSKGLTKETDERIAKMVNSVTTNEKEIKRRSEKMRQGRLDRTVPTLYKEKHSQWRGGVSSLSGVCKVHKKLYKEWKFPLLSSAKFKCQECSSANNLDIHHDKESMSSIVRKFAKQYKWEQFISSEVTENSEEILNLKYEIAEAVASYHIINNVSGQVLCRECHKKKHKNLNFTPINIAIIYNVTW